MDNSTNKKSRKRTKMADELNTNNPQDGTSSSTLSMTEGAPLSTEKNGAKRSKKSKKNTTEEALIPIKKNAAKKSKKSKKRKQMATELDTNNVTGGASSSASSTTEGFMSTEEGAKVYKMNHPKRGQAIIFNHSKFDGKDEIREGTEYDVQKLEKCLKKLDFAIKIHENKSLIEILDILEALKKGHSDEDCILVYVLTHGSKGKLLARDREYSKDILLSSFTADACPTLASKPKLFFIQACQGRKEDKGKEMMSKTDDIPSDTCKIPNEADILVMYSTPPDYVAYRDPKSGSPFVEAFCRVLREESNSMDLLSMTTRMNLQVAHYESIHGNKQIPYVTSRLTRDIFFNSNVEKKSKAEKETQTDAEVCLLEGTGDKILCSSAPVDTEGPKLTK